MRFSPQKPTLSYGILITILAYFIFAIGSAFVKGINPSFPTIEIIFIQNLVCFLCILPNFFRKRFLYIKPRLMPVHLIRDIAGVMSYFCYFYAIKKLNLVSATLLSYTSPFFTPLIWMLWTREKVEKSVWWTIIMGFIGILFILKPNEQLFNVAAFVGIAAGIFTAISFVSIKILNREMESLSRTLFYLFFVSTIVTAPFAIMGWQRPSFWQLFAMIMIGLSTFGGQFLLTAAYKHGTASFLSPLCYSMIIFAGIISWVVFKHKPGYMTWIGAGLIIIGGTITYILNTKPANLVKMFEHNGEDRAHWWKKINNKNQPPFTK